MKTQALIAALAGDVATPGRPPGRALAVALAAGSVAGLAVFFLILGPRHDLPSALHSGRFLLKFVVTLAGVAAGLTLTARLARPGRPALATVLALPFIVIGGAVVWETVTIPQSQWAARLVGVNAAVCLASIPIIAIAPLAAILLALRTAAPTRPRLAGAAAGLLAGAIAATFYAAHCPDDSPFFVAAWYTLGTGIVAAAGAVLGRRVLRW